MSDGLNIGLMIRQKKMATVVFDTCASVCALIWLAGTPRAVFEDSNVGFHAVYNGTEDKTINSGGNALVGAYLKQLGFSYQTIFYLTQTAPEEMEWLNGDKAKKYGIAVTLLDK